MSFTQLDLENYWKNEIKSDKPLPQKFIDYYNNIEYSLSTVLSSLSIDIAKEILNLYKFETIFTKQTNTNFDPFIKTINDCYQNKIFDNNFQNILVNKSNQVPFYTAKSIYPNYQLNILYPGITYTNEYYMRTIRGVCRMEICKNNFTLAIYENYNNETKYKNTPYWNYSNGNNNTNKVYMNSDGNLIIYNNNIKVWESQTSGNPGAYGELLQQGFFVIKAPDGQIIKCLNPINLETSNLDAYQRYASGYDFILEGGHEKCSPTSYIIPGMRYTKGFSWINGDYIIIVQSDGNFIIYYTPTRQTIWQTRNTNQYVLAPNPNPNLQLKTKDGNLVLWREGIHENNEQGRYNSVQWSSDTGGKFTYIPTVQLISSGFLVIFNQNNNIYKTYPHDPIINFLNDVQYDPSNIWVMDFLTEHIFKLGKDRWSYDYQNKLKSEFKKK